MLSRGNNGLANGRRLGIRYKGSVTYGIKQRYRYRAMYRSEAMR